VDPTLQAKEQMSEYRMETSGIICQKEGQILSKSYKTDSHAVLGFSGSNA
jgi:hypothetical protein